MEKCPFTAEIWEKFSKNKLTAEDMEPLKKHDRENCMECKKFFDDLDLEVFNETVKAHASALAEIFKQRYEPGNGEREAMFSEIFSNLSKEKPAKRFPIKWMALAASLILVSSVLFSVHYIKNIPPHENIKGTPLRVPSIVLKVAVLKKQKNIFERGVSGGEYSKEDVLFFRYEIKVRSYVYILRTDGQNMEILHPSDPSAPLIQETGVYEFREDGSAQGLPLKGLDGRQIFMAIASQKPMDVKSELEPTVMKHLDGKTAPSSKEWGLDIFVITVANGH